MIKVVRIVKPECYGCMGATFGDCKNCTDRACEVVLCKDCRFNRQTLMHREKTLCTKLHAWVEPYDFCAWGEERKNG